MSIFPKLRYPIHTKGLSNEERMILLAYDIIWRLRNDLDLTANQGSGLLEDVDANLANLGHYIEHNLCGMDMALRFEGYDNQPIVTEPVFEKSSKDTKDEWMSETLNKINS